MCGQGPFPKYHPKYGKYLNTGVYWIWKFQTPPDSKYHHPNTLFGRSSVFGHGGTRSYFPQSSLHHRPEESESTASATDNRERRLFNLIRHGLGMSSLGSEHHLSGQLPRCSCSCTDVHSTLHLPIHPKVRSPEELFMPGPRAEYWCVYWGLERPCQKPSLPTENT